MLLPSKNFNICTITEKYELQHLYHHHAHHAQGNRLGFYEKLGEYEARPAYRWWTDEDAFECKDGGDWGRKLQKYFDLRYNFWSVADN